MLHATGSNDAENAYTCAVFRALVDAIVPPTLRQVGAVDVEPVAGAVQLCVDQFVMRDIDHSQFIPVGERGEQGNQMPLSRATALLLEMGAAQLIRRRLALFPPDAGMLSGCGFFPALSRIDRLQALELIDRLEISLHRAPPPYQDNPAMVQTMIDSLNQLTMFGYYTEWWRKGNPPSPASSSRCEAAIHPVWRQIGYPGPAFGYRDFRGFVLKYPHDKGVNPYE